MINQEKMIQIGSAICLLEPIFIKSLPIKKISVVVPNHKNRWWHLGYTLSTYFIYIDPVLYLNQTHVLLSYFYEEFFQSNFDIEKIESCPNFYLQGIKFFVCQYEFTLNNTAHQKFRAIGTLRSWLEEKNLPKSDIDYLVNLKRIQSLNKQNKSIYGAS